MDRSPFAANAMQDAIIRFKDAQRAMLLLGVWASFAVAGSSVSWNNPAGGSFHVGTNWVGGTPPGANDAALFDLDTSGYTVVFSSDVTNDVCVVLDDTVVFDLNGNRYTHVGVLRLAQTEGEVASLTVFDGTVAPGVLVVASASSTTASLSLSGPNTRVEIDTFANVGSNGAGTLSIGNGATVAHMTPGWHMDIGVQPAATGVVTVTGADSSLTVQDAIEVGHFGTGTLLVANGAGVSSTRGNIAISDGASGTATVRDADSRWACSKTLTVGVNGTAELHVLDGGGVFSPAGVIANGPTADATVTISGTGAVWLVDGPLTVGVNGTAELHVLGGGRVSAEYLAGTGSVSVSGSGSTLECTGTGFSVTGTLDITGGATVEYESVAVNVSTTAGGAGSQWLVNNQIVVGAEGGGALNIIDGALVTSSARLSPSGTSGMIGWLEGGSGGVIVTGSGSQWTQDGAMSVGFNSTGEVIIEQGGWIESAGGSIARNPGSTGSVIVTGTDSRWGIDGLFEMGVGGPATLTVSGGGLVEQKNPDPLIVGPEGEIVVQAGGTIISDGAVRVGDRGGPGVAAITVTGTGATWTVDGEFELGLLGPATLTVSGGGSVGKQNPDPMIVGPEGELSGDGSVEADLVNHGTLWAGTKDPEPLVGALTIDGALRLEACGALSVGVDFTAANVAETGAPAGSPIGGRLIVTGSAALGGSLVLDVTGTPIVGASFEFLEYGSRTGSFNKVTAEGLDGVAFAVTYGPTGATLAVVNDCNRNGVDDLVDISSASSIDCNGNDVPDECDIRECPPGTVACDDCNLNFLPDSCDIASGASPDVEPADGVPDECRKPVVGGDWGSDIWDLGGPNPYPDDVVGVSGLHITLDAVSVFLDVDAEVPTTRVLGGATLSMGQSGDAGDLTLADPGGVLLRGGTVEIAEGRTLDIAGGRFEIGLGGVYRAVTGMVAGSPGDPCAGRPRAVSISSSLLLNAFGPGGNEGGQLLLSGCMEHDCSGDAVLDGTNATLPCGGASVAGGRTPPTLRISDHALLHVGDLLAMTGPVDFTHNSSDNMQLGGDFDNRSTTPECFDFAGGGMTLDGASDQTFEVAGRELGSTPDGFGGGADSNFSLDRLQIGSDDAGAAVAFVNEQTNTVGSGPCREALYVRELTLKAGSTVSVRDARVYYQTLIEEPGVTVHRFGCGDLIDMSCPLVDAPAIEPLAQIKNRYISFVPGAAGTQSALAFTLAEVHGFESFNGEVRWVGEPETFTDEGLGTFTAAPLRCDPFVTDWGRVGIVSVYGDAIVPESVYEIESIPSGQIASSGGSGPQPTGIGACPQGLRVYTGAWGDVVEPFAGSGPSQPDFSDIASLVDKFTASPAAPSKTRAQLQPNVVRPDSPIDFSDIAATIDAFTGTGYPYAGPSACP